MLKNKSRDQAAERIAPLVDLAVRYAPQVSDIQLHRGQRRLQQSLDQQRPLRRRGFILPVCAVAAAVVGVFAVAASWQSRTSTLVMTVHGASWDKTSGALAPLDNSSMAQLHFSDGSEVQMEPHTVARMHELSRAGAMLTLERGRLQAHIAPRRKASWDFHAGPFNVHVVGTAFDLNWQHSTLSVVMRSGQVSVSGPLVGNGLPVSAGQTLHVNLVSGKVRLESPDADLPPQPTVSNEPQAPAAQPLPEHHAEEALPAPSTTRRPPSVQPRQPERWSHMLRTGGVAQIVGEARTIGVERVMHQSSSGELQALADAARYMRDNALATRALQAQRARFAGSKAAREAAFHLGRLTETGAKQPNHALLWYDRYLDEDASGTYRAEAMGRKMVVLAQLQQTQKARAVAQQYLRHDPQGPYAKIARGLVGTE